MILFVIVTKFSKFLVFQNSSTEERYIRQMQYMAWPDHGVPDDSSDFLDFVMRVRQNRTGMVEPTIVHCRLVLEHIVELLTTCYFECLTATNNMLFRMFDCY